MKKMHRSLIHAVYYDGMELQFQYHVNVSVNDNINASTLTSEITSCLHQILLSFRRVQRRMSGDIVLLISCD